MSTVKIIIKFSKELPETILKQLKSELVEKQRVPERLTGIFKVFDENVAVTVDYE
jgi:hypothetical protein